MPSFIHTADVHLDTPFTARFTPKQMQLRRKELMQTFQKIVRAAKSRDFLFISGDLFDGQFVSAETLSFVKRCFAEIPDTHVMIAAGNHDPMENGSAYAAEDWGKNVHIFSTQMEYIDFPELETRVHGISFQTSRQEQPLLKKLDLAPNRYNILVMHGEIAAEHSLGVYNPIWKSALADCGADYVALGHIHQTGGLQRSGNAWYAYPGIPEGRGFDEDGDRGYFDGEAEKGRVQLRWIPVCRRHFWNLSVDVSGMEDGIQVLDEVTKTITQTGCQDDLFQIKLTGKIARGLIHTELLEQQGKEQVFYLSVRDCTQMEYHAEDLIKENTLRGEFEAAMLEKISQMPEDEKEVGYLALTLGIEAIERGRIK